MTSLPDQTWTTPDSAAWAEHFTAAYPQSGVPADDVFTWFEEAMRAAAMPTPGGE